MHRKLLKVFGTFKAANKKCEKISFKTWNSHILSTETETLVQSNEARDEKLCVGKNDDGTRQHVEKRLLLCNANELYEQFT